MVWSRFKYHRQFPLQALVGVSLLKITFLATILPSHSKTWSDHLPVLSNCFMLIVFDNKKRRFYVKSTKRSTAKWHCNRFVMPDGAFNCCGGKPQGCHVQPLSFSHLSVPEYYGANVCLLIFSIEKTQHCWQLNVSIIVLSFYLLSHPFFKLPQKRQGHILAKNNLNKSTERQEREVIVFFVDSATAGTMDWWEIRGSHIRTHW